MSGAERTELSDQNWERSRKASEQIKRLASMLASYTGVQFENLSVEDQRIWLRIANEAMITVPQLLKELDEP